MTFYIKQNDTSPSMIATLSDGDGSAIALAGATVRFHMKASGATIAKVDGVATIVDPVKGTVRYDWVDSDTDSAGNFLGEFQVTYLGGQIETFPNDGYIKIKITDDIK